MEPNHTMKHGSFRDDDSACPPSPPSDGDSLPKTDVNNDVAGQCPVANINDAEGAKEIVFPLLVGVPNVDPVDSACLPPPNNEADCVMFHQNPEVGNDDDAKNMDLHQVLEVHNDLSCPPSPSPDENMKISVTPTLTQEGSAVLSPPSSESGLGSNIAENDSDGEAATVGDSRELIPSRKRSGSDVDDVVSPKRMLRSASSPNKAKYKDFFEPDYDLLVSTVLQNRKEKKKKESKKILASEKGLEKCPLCRQVLVSKQLTCFNGAPDGAIPEKEALALPDLKILGEGEVPLNRLVLFSLYDENLHLCSLDNGSIERGVKLLISGFVKPIFDEDRTSATGGTASKDIGPITEWWIGGYEEPEPYIGLSTKEGEYILGAPSTEYAPYLEPIFEKVFLSKLVIQFLQNQEGAAFEDLLTYVKSQERPPGIPHITEDSLMRHAQFICDQVVSFDEAGFSDDENESTDDWRKLIKEPCMRSLMEFAGAIYRTRETSIISRNRGPIRRRRRKKILDELGTWTKAATTPLVLEVFDSLFRGQIDSKPKVSEETVDEDDVNSLDQSKLCFQRNRSTYAKSVAWIGEPAYISKKDVYYRSALVGDLVLNVGDFVSYQGEEGTLIGRIQHMWEQPKQLKLAHLVWFIYGKQTILGENADPNEIFMCNRCESVPLSGVISGLVAQQKVYSDNWQNEGGLEPHSSSSPSTLFYSKMYDDNQCRFEDIVEPSFSRDSKDFRYCPSCATTCAAMEYEVPSTQGRVSDVTSEGEIEFSSAMWKGEEFTRGQSVYLESTTFEFDPVNVSWLDVKYDPDPPDFDNEDLYPERYRKKFDSGRTSNDQAPDPFCIGLISSIRAPHEGFCKPSDIKLRVFKFYRPENTEGVINKRDIAQLDYTLLFASEEEVEIDFSFVKGKCYSVYEPNLGGLEPGKWSVSGPDRFYFLQSYDSFAKTLKAPLEVFTLLGRAKNNRAGDQSDHLRVPEYPAISKKLKSLDLFAGCGGLTDGLHKSGVAEVKWAVEKVTVAAKAFQLNNPQAEVFTMDVNDMLKDVMGGGTRNDRGQIYPKKGEVEMIVGGPPCQGFSGLNRFTKNEYSLFKNSLVVSMMSYCDYYRPKYFLLENVRNLVAYGKGTVLIAIFSALLKMGYQAAVAILQAGHYGVPQTRRRTFIIAAAPGEVLPRYPEPRHVFRPTLSHLSVIVNDAKFDAGLEFTWSAPYRTITVYDSLSDLPNIKSGFSKEEIPYDKNPETHFQRQVRDGNTVLRDHICKELAPIVQTRIDHVPNIRNADWRDLPNIEVDCGNGQKCYALLYTNHDPRVGKSKRGALRGVCSCAMDGECDPTDRQFSTLIPWSLPHTAKKNHSWVGLYGRIQWDEYFITTVTNPEPMGKQGKVLHPVQNRVVSVRECARSQGFDDKFMFYGDVHEKHKQIGNAVPPPLGKAIGLEILKSVATKEKTYVPPTCKSFRPLLAKQASNEGKECSSSSESEDEYFCYDDEDSGRTIKPKSRPIKQEKVLAEEIPTRRCLWRKCKSESKNSLNPTEDSVYEAGSDGEEELCIERKVSVEPAEDDDEEKPTKRCSWIASGVDSDVSTLSDKVPDPLDNPAHSPTKCESCDLTEDVTDTKLSAQVDCSSDQCKFNVIPELNPEVDSDTDVMGMKSVHSSL